MPWLCLECDSKVEPSITKPGVAWCPGCEKEVTRDDIYRVGKRFFGSGAGAMMAMIAAGAMMGGLSRTERVTKPEATSTFQAIKKQRRKKVHGLRKKRRRHERQKRR